MATLVMVEYLSPIALAEETTHRANPRLPTIAGKTIGFRVEWPAFDVFTDYVSGKLRDDYGAAATPIFHSDFAASASVYKTPEWREWLSTLDAAVLGLAG